MYRRGNAKELLSIHIFFNIHPALPPLRKHEAEYMIPEESTAEELRLYIHIFYFIYIYSIYISVNRYSVRQCIVNHVENKFCIALYCS
jgi:hypothetical protein